MANQEFGAEYLESMDVPCYGARAPGIADLQLPKDTDNAPLIG